MNKTHPSFECWQCKRCFWKVIDLTGEPVLLLECPYCGAECNGRPGPLQAASHHGDARQGNRIGCRSLRDPRLRSYLRARRRNTHPGDLVPSFLSFPRGAWEREKTQVCGSTGALTLFQCAELFEPSGFDSLVYRMVDTGLSLSATRSFHIPTQRVGTRENAGMWVSRSKC